MSDIKIVENGKNYSLLLLDFFESEQTFTDEGHEGNGYDWQSVISYLISSEYPELENKIKYDSEGSMFVAYGDDKEALGEVENIITNLINNQDHLKTLIQEVPEDMWD